jgi:hypothetical protein
MLMNEMPTAHLPTTRLTEQLMGSCIHILRRGSRRALGSRLLLKGWDINTFPPPRAESGPEHSWEEAHYFLLSTYRKEIKCVAGIKVMFLWWLSFKASFLSARRRSYVRL